MNYKLGDEVVCIDAITIPGTLEAPLVRGAVYRVMEIHDCMGGSINVGLLLPASDGPMYCKICDKRTQHHWHLSWRFIKLDRLTQDQEAHGSAVQVFAFHQVKRETAMAWLEAWRTQSSNMKYK